MPRPAVPQRDSARPPQQAGEVRRGTPAPNRRGWARGGLGVGVITGSLLASHATAAAAAADSATGTRPACTPRVHALSAQQVSKFFLSNEVCGLARETDEAAATVPPAAVAGPVAAPLTAPITAPGAAPVAASRAAPMAAPVAAPLAAPDATPVAVPDAGLPKPPAGTAPRAVPMREVFATMPPTAPIAAPITAPSTARLTTTLSTPHASRVRQRPSPTAQRAVALATDVDAVARAHDIDPLLLHAIAHVESRHNAAVVSPAGALGVMQVMPATGRRFGAVHAGALHDARTNLEASAAYLKFLQRRFDSDLRLVLAGYNAGEGAVEKHGRRVPPYRETQRYVVDVLSQYERLQAVASSLAAPRGNAAAAP